MILADALDLADPVEGGIGSYTEDETLRQLQETFCEDVLLQMCEGSDCAVARRCAGRAVQRLGFSAADALPMRRRADLIGRRTCSAGPR